MPFFHLLKAYLRHWLHVVDEHSIHSPFFFDYYTRVLRGKTDEKKFEKIEELRFNLLGNTTLIQVEDLGAGVSVAVIAARFHNALADVVLGVCERLRDEHSLSTVALSGGVFQNSLLLTRVLDRLEGRGFKVLTHRQVPCNDGGISLGQAAVAAARLAAGR